jgi:hypothetical protein
MTGVNETLELGEDIRKLRSVSGAYVDDIVSALPAQLASGVTIGLGDAVSAYIARKAVADNLRLGHRSPSSGTIVGRHNTTCRRYLHYQATLF